MKSRRPRAVALFLAVAATAALAFSAAPGVADDEVRERAAYAQIEGTGSTWSQIILEQWIADVDSNGIKVVYTGGGSTKGRQDFAKASVDFAISEIPYQGTDETGVADTSDGRDYSYLPIVAGGTAFTYQLKVGNELVRNLRLSGETIAKIFTGKITNWNDEDIADDNNGRQFPDKVITPVVRSDGSGTTAQFTTWMDKSYPSIWRPYFGRSGLTSYYPRPNGVNMLGQSGSDQVMNTVSGFAGDGTIGYVEYSYPVNKNYPVVKVLNKGGYYVEPTKYATAVALTKAKINQDKSDPAKYLTQILDGVYANPDPRAYPISSYSYMIIPTGAADSRMTTPKRQALADFLYYSLCAGQTKAGAYGYSPLTLNLVQAGFSQIAKLKQADPAVDLTDRDVKSCNNPTFDGTNPSRNVLAEKAAQPAACDKEGEGPCGTATGTDPDANNAGGDEPAADPSTPADPGGTGTDPGGAVDPAAPGGAVTDPAAPGGEAPVVNDPALGGAVASDTGSDNSTLYANPTLVSDRPLDSKTFGWVAVLELLALVLLPGFVVAAMRRRRKAGTA